MLRFATRSLATRMAIVTYRPRSIPARSQSSAASGSGGGGGKFVAFTTTALLSAGVGTIAYASVSDEFRLTVENAIPGSKDVLDVVLGEKEDSKIPVKKPEPSSPSKMKIPMTSTPPMPELKSPPVSSTSVSKKKELEAVIETKEAKVANDTSLEAKISAPSTKVVKEVTKPATTSNTKTAEIVALELALEEACKDMNSKVAKAINASNASIDATRRHMELVKALMEDTAPKDEKKAWNEIFEAASKKSELLKETDKFINDAKDALNMTIKSIEVGRKNSVTQNVDALKNADETTSSSLTKLEESITSLDTIQKEAKLIDAYRGLVEEGRQQFQKEIEAILPGAKLSGGGSLSEDELNIFMTHAYRKVCQLQQELSEARTIGHTVTDENNQKEVDANLQAELDAQRRDLEVEHHRKMTSQREEMEKDMRTQLRRQAAAHSDHINDVQEVQAKELGRLHERAVDEALANEKSGHKRELAAIKGTLDGLEKALEEQNYMSIASVESQELWVACVSLRDALKSSESRVEVNTRVKAIEAATKNSAAFKNDEFIHSVLEAIPQAAIDKGVPPSREIKSRFNRVEEMAKRTALVGEEGGSLLLYALSYLQSLLVMSPARTCSVPNKSSEAIDIEALNTFDIVWLARQALEADDIEQAVRYMNLLRGEPRRQASDWLSSARVHLEIHQISEALAAYATAIGAEAIPVSKNTS